MGQYIVVDRSHAGVSVIRLNRPERLNALDAEALDALLDALDEADEDADCRVVILTGEGRAFCAGLDLKSQRVDRGLAGPQRLITSMQRSWTRLVPRLRALRPAVIAAVNGPAVGGGFAMALGCDIRILAKSAMFQDAFAKVGVSGCELGVGWLLPRMIGLPRAMELALTGRAFGASEALAFGLAHEVCDDGELLRRAVEKAGEIASNPPFAVWMTRQTMWAALETPGIGLAIDFENRVQTLCLMTDDAREQMAARFERRPPVYRNS